MLEEPNSALTSSSSVAGDENVLRSDPGPAAQEKLQRKLSRRMLDTIRKHDLVQPGDRIMVAVSGGKDSYTLLQLLWRACQRAPFSFELLAFHLDQAQPGYDGTPLREWLEEFGAPYRIHHEDTYTTVTEQAEESSSSYCAPCSRLRRGILYTWAEKLGCNKIALGHHREDALETLLLNLFFSGRLQAMPPTYTTNDGRFEVIRPLLECAESDIAEYARGVRFPILPCNLCGSQDGLKRVQIKSLLTELEQRIPNVREVMLSALGNVRPTHLLDAEVAEAWQRAADEFPPRR